MCVVYWHCTAQLSMFNMEKRFKNKIIIIIIIILLLLLLLLLLYGRLRIAEENCVSVSVSVFGSDCLSVCHRAIRGLKLR